MGSKDGNLELTTHERTKAMVTASKSAGEIKKSGQSAAERVEPTGITADQALAQLENWPQAPKTLGKTIIEHYGPPHEMTPTKMFWHRVRSEERRVGKEGKRRSTTHQQKEKVKRTE